MGADGGSHPLSDQTKAETQGPNRLDLALGSLIRERRKVLGLSQTALANAAGVTFQQIQKYERGFNRVSFSRLVEIARALDCRISDLVADVDDPSAAQPHFRGEPSLLDHPDAAQLLAGYAAMPPNLRRAVLNLMLVIAKQRPLSDA